RAGPPGAAAGGGPGGHPGGTGSAGGGGALRVAGHPRSEPPTAPPQYHAGHGDGVGHGRTLGRGDPRRPHGGRGSGGHAAPVPGAVTPAGAPRSGRRPLPRGGASGPWPPLPPRSLTEPGSVPRMPVASCRMLSKEGRGGTVKSTGIVRRVDELGWV